MNDGWRLWIYFPKALALCGNVFGPRAQAGVNPNPQESPERVLGVDSGGFFGLRSPWLRIRHRLKERCHHAWNLFLQLVWVGDFPIQVHFGILVLDQEIQAFHLPIPLHRLFCLHQLIIDCCPIVLGLLHFLSLDLDPSFYSQIDETFIKCF